MNSTRRMSYEAHGLGAAYPGPCQSSNHSHTARMECLAQLDLANEMCPMPPRPHTMQVSGGRIPTPNLTPLDEVFDYWSESRMQQRRVNRALLRVECDRLALQINVIK